MTQSGVKAMEKPGRATGLLLALGLFLVCSCAPQRASQNFEVLQDKLKNEQESLSALRQKEAQLESRGPEPAPVVEPVLPSFNPLEETKISVQARNEPLHDILYTVAGNAGLNLVVEPELSLDNRVTVSFESAPAAVVVDRLLRAYDYAWEIADNVLYVKRFEEKLFRLDFMNAKTTTTIASGGDIFGSLASGGSGGSGSQKGSFQMDVNMGKGNEDGSLYGLLIKTVEPILGATGGAAGTSEEKLVLDSVAGTVFVRTTPKKMKSVELVISNLKKNLSRQVVIDARFLEVELSDNYNLGINWGVVATRIFDNKNLGLAMTLNPLAGVATQTPTSTSNTWNPMLMTNRMDSYGINTSHIEALVSALETFGKVRTVSNPHVRARHGQPALFTTGKSEAYIKKITTTSSGQSGTTSTSSEDAQAFTGVMLGVVPFINEDATVELQVFPIVSAADLSKTSNVGGSTVTLPVVNVKNVSTTAKTRSGDLVILGGLIDKSQTNQDNAVPGVSQLPLFGDLFKSTVNAKRLRELVVLLSVRVIQ